MNCQPKYLRWGACAQEICFKVHATYLLSHSLAQETDFLAAFFGVGKSLPMWRGGGIDQPLLLQLARKAVGSECGERAEWIHVYPEAGVYQWKYELGGRRNRRDEIGKLKWGVGKVIAHHPLNRTRHSFRNSDSKAKSPIVIPFYFIGPETITPFDNPLNRKVTTKIPQIGQKIVLRFGEPIMYDDLLEEFEKEEVRSGHVDAVEKALRVYTCCDNPSSPHHHPRENDFGRVSRMVTEVKDRLLGQHESDTPTPYDEKTNEKLPVNQDSNLLMYDLASWKSTEREKKLYHRITSRIEIKLEELGKRCVEDIE